MNPRIWGPSVWAAIHLIALGYPADPSEDEKAAYRAFFTALGPVLPCAACSAHYAQNLQELPLEPALQAGGAALFRWTVDLHNLVNAATGKPAVGADVVRARLTKGSPASGAGAGQGRAGYQGLALSALGGVVVGAALVVAYLALVRKTRRR